MLNKTQEMALNAVVGELPYYLAQAVKHTFYAVLGGNHAQAEFETAKAYLQSFLNGSREMPYDVIMGFRDKFIAFVNEYQKEQGVTIPSDTIENITIMVLDVDNALEAFGDIDWI